MAYMVITGLLVGIVLGLVLQRGRICFTGAFRDMLLTKDFRIFYAMLVVIAISSIGFFVMGQLGIVNLPGPGSFNWLSVSLGGFVFGIGIIMAGGCATGTWQRAGEGYISGWIALFGFILMAVMMRGGVFGGLREQLQSVSLGYNSISATMGLPMWIFVVIITALALFLVVRELRKPKIAIPSPKPRKTGLAHLLFEKRWHPFITAIFVGIIAIVAWPISAASGRNASIGITTPSANILEYLITGDNVYINWAVFLVIGIMVGAFFAAKASKEFRLRVPDGRTCAASFLGGLTMGFGAVLGAGCTIGNGLIQTALMTWQGWTSLLFIILGTWTATYFAYILPKNRRRTALAAG